MLAFNAFVPVGEFSKVSFDTNDNGECSATRYNGTIPVANWYYGQYYDDAERDYNDLCAVPNNGPRSRIALLMFPNN